MSKRLARTETETEIEMTEVETTETTETTEPIDAPNGKAKVSTIFNTDGTVSLTIIGGTKGIMTFNPAELPDSIKEKLLPFSVAKKLGSQGACAGKDGIQAEEAVLKVWEGLRNGDWSVRAPAAEKITVKKNDILANLQAMSEGDRNAAMAALKALNIKIDM